ncbi:MAG: nicotinate-nucleotide pyrophosphorylase, partial [Bacteroidetes bacterium]|nr:nicotinate-nucleotide pyrophosphorylase [Bacteroidota bacterium]
PERKAAAAKLLVKADGILAGVEVAELVAHKIDTRLSLQVFMEDGAAMKAGDIAFHLHGDEKAILRAERLILNFMQRMSGIATNTARYVKAVEGTKTKILDTRKTTPGLRAFEKWAVQIGGGVNHRVGLYDMIMLKDNHIDFCGGIKPAILAVKKYREEKGLDLKVEVETRSLEDVQTVLETGFVNRIMFDNFSVENVYKGVEMVKNRYETEVSGGITLDTIGNYAQAGPDFISVGALTHSSISLDLSLKSL